MHRNTLRQIVLPAAGLVGDLVAAFAGLSLAWWLRYDTRIGQLGIPVETATFAAYLPLLLVGVALLVGTYAQLGRYPEAFRYLTLTLERESDPAVRARTAGWYIASPLIPGK